MAYLDLRDIQTAYAEYLDKYYHFTKKETAEAVKEFPNPYSDPYLTEVFSGECEIEGETYEKYLNIVDLKTIRPVEIPSFNFYIYYRTGDLCYHTVKEYRDSKKIYEAYSSA